MNGRIIRHGKSESMLELPEIGRLHIGKKSDKGYPMSVDYFIPDSKYAGLFEQALGDKPSTITIVFPDDDAEKVCNERYEYRDDNGDLFAYGDGATFNVWDGKGYMPYKVSEYPDIMKQVSKQCPNKRVKDGKDGWDVSLKISFIIPAVRGVMGVWSLRTKGAASTIPNVRKSFDSVQIMRGTVTNTTFDLSVKFAKSNKPGQNSRYPVISLVANDTRIDEIKAMLQPKQNVAMLVANKEN